MNTPWLILNTRYGNEIFNPTEGDITAALKEVYFENHPSLTEHDYAEHPNAFLRLGYDDGPMYALDVYRKGAVLFGQWADADYEREIEPEKWLEGVTFEKALSFWLMLAQNRPDSVAAEPWGS
jgi:hypothetical protein